MTRPRLWRDWTLACVAGEVVGIGIAGLAAGVLLSTIGEPVTAVERWGAFGLLVGAGALEGLALGGFQWRVLRRAFPAIRARQWVGVTVVVAVGGWVLGMLPSTLSAPAASGGEPFDPPLALVALGAIAGGAAAGLVFGAAQWTVLRHHTPEARRWIGANALGWALGIGWIYVAASLPPEGSAPLAVAAFGIAGGLLSGLSMGGVTGRTLTRLTPEPNS